MKYNKSSKFYIAFISYIIVNTIFIHSNIALAITQKSRSRSPASKTKPPVAMEKVIAKGLKDLIQRANNLYPYMEISSYLPSKYIVPNVLSLTQNGLHLAKIANRLIGAILLELTKELEFTVENIHTEASKNRAQFGYFTPQTIFPTIDKWDVVGAFIKTGISFRGAVDFMENSSTIGSFTSDTWRPVSTRPFYNDALTEAGKLRILGLDVLMTGSESLGISCLRPPKMSEMLSIAIQLDDMLNDRQDPIFIQVVGNMIQQKTAGILMAAAGNRVISETIDKLFTTIESNRAILRGLRKSNRDLYNKTSIPSHGHETISYIKSAISRLDTRAENFVTAGSKVIGGRIYDFLNKAQDLLLLEQAGLMVSQTADEAVRAKIQALRQAMTPEDNNGSDPY